MNWRLSMWIVVFCLWTVPGHAALLDPWAFTSLGMLNTTETISINTDTLQLSGGAVYTGALDPVSGASLFTFDDITATNLSIFGTRTLGLLSRGNMAFTGTIDLLGSGGLEMGATNSLALSSLNAFGSGGDIVLHANQFTLSGSINVVNRSLSITSATDIAIVGGSGIAPFTGGPIPIINLGEITITSGTVAPVPLPAALPLFASGLAMLSLLKRRAS